MGQLAHEADGVGAQHRLATGRSRRRVLGFESREELVSTSTPASVNTLRRVDLRRWCSRRATPSGELRAFEPCAGSGASIEIAKLDLELSDAAHDPTPIDLELSLTGPLVPIPPACWDRTRPMPRRRGSRYLLRASSTCARPSWVWAFWAKMSRITAVRSIAVLPRIARGSSAGQASARRRRPPCRHPRPR